MLLAASDKGGKWITERMGLSSVLCAGCCQINNKHNFQVRFLAKGESIAIYIKPTTEKEA